MKIEFELSEVLTKEQMKEIAIEELRYAVRKQFGGSEEKLNRLITNISFSYVIDMVNQAYDGKLSEILHQKITKVIDELSSYCVFKRKDSWEKDDSVAYKALQEEMAAARPLIKAKVEEVINNYPFDELKADEIGEIIHECIMDKLFTKNSSAEAPDA